MRRVYGENAVGRFLELQHLEPFLAANQEYPIIVCLDLFGFDLKEATDLVGHIRDSAFPKVVFNLYLDQTEYRERRHELPEHWQTRFTHYFKTYKEDEDVDFEPILLASLRSSQYEALHNMGHNPIRLTPVFKKGMVSTEEDSGVPEPRVAFISYSRDDWRGFVSDLVSDLSNASQQVWIDQEYVLGGDDWLDAIGEALDVCDTLLLVLSPEALASRNVRMEYRYFFRMEKPIIPILYSHVEQLPFELATINYLDVTKGSRETLLADLLKVLHRHRDSNKG